MLAAFDKLFTFSGSNKLLTVDPKVIALRDELIEKAAKLDEWDEVLRLLDHPLANAERKDRAYGLLSLHWNIGTADNLQIE